MNYTFRNYRITKLEVSSRENTPETLEEMNYDLNHWFSTFLLL